MMRLLDVTLITLAIPAYKYIYICVLFGVTFRGRVAVALQINAALSYFSYKFAIQFPYVIYYIDVIAPNCVTRLVTEICAANNCFYRIHYIFMHFLALLPLYY